MTGPLDDAFAHHVWASLRVLDACSTLTREQLQTSVPGTYGTILETAFHLVESDTFYLFVITDGRVAWVDEDTIEVADLRTVMETNEAHWTSVLAEDRDPDAMTVVRSDDGSEFHAPMGVRLAQALHHGTDHRSQICTALTAIGIEPPGIDVWDYAEATGRTVDIPAPD